MQLSSVLHAHLNIHVPFMPVLCFPSSCMCPDPLPLTSIFLFVRNFSSCCCVSCSPYCLLKQNSTCICKSMSSLSEDQPDLESQTSPSCTVFSLKRRNELVLRSIGNEESLVPPVLFPMPDVLKAVWSLSCFPDVKPEDFH